MDPELSNDQLDVEISTIQNSCDKDSSSELFIAVECLSENKTLNESIDDFADIGNQYINSEKLDKICNNVEKGSILDSPKNDTSTSKPKISRELKELHKAAAESKIITEFTNVKEKKRYRKPLNSPNTSRNLEENKKADDILKNENETGKNNEENKTPKSNRIKGVRTLSDNKSAINLESLFNTKGKDIDGFCWQCHKDDVNLSCKTCPRSFHQRCVRGIIMEVSDWCCPECVSILQAETTDTRSSAMKQVSLSHLCELLKFALKRMSEYAGAEPFLHPVDKSEFPDYAKYVVHPMDLSKLEFNIKKNLYGSTEAFIADTKWILHNSVIYNSIHTKLTSVAKGIIKICKQEMNEIETCPECYLKANTKNDRNWFLEVCSQPHMLVWAKLKGYPYWPAKAMTISSNGLVDVRFFGAHDKAWIPMKDCLLYSEKDPNFSEKGKRSDFVESIKELGIYIKNLEKKFGKFHHAPFKTPYPSDQATIYNIMLPSYKYKPNIMHKHNNKATDSTKSALQNINTLDATKLITQINQEAQIDNKNNISTDDDSIIDDYDTEDDETQKDILNDFKSNNTKVVKHSPLRTHVRIRGGKINSTGKIKTIKVSRESKDENLWESSNEFSPTKELLNNNKTSPLSKIIKRKFSTDISEVCEKKNKFESAINDSEDKNNDNLLVIADNEISQKELTLTNNSYETIAAEGNIELSPVNNLSSNQKNNINNSVNENNKTLSIANKLPQISITGLMKSGSVNKLDSDLTKSQNSRDLKLSSNTRVMIRKRSFLTEDYSNKKNISYVKVNPLSEMRSKEENDISKGEKIPRTTEIKADSTPSNMEHVEIKTEPMDDYEIEKSSSENNLLSNNLNNHIDNEILNDKKQSARKTFASQSKTQSSPCIKKNLKDIQTNSVSMVYIPHASTSSIPKLETISQKATYPSNFQSDLSEIVPYDNEITINTSINNSLIEKSKYFNSIENNGENGEIHANVQTELLNKLRHDFVSISSPTEVQFPTECGPVTKMINENALKLTNYFQKLLHETLIDFGNNGSTEAKVKKLQADVESLKWIHKQELCELKHNTELILLEIRNSFEVENAHNLAKYRKKAEAERLRSIQEAKSKQWCVYCGKEAQFYCCWNTSYCDHECQRKHWSVHMTLCGQHREANQEDSSNNVIDAKRVKTKAVNRSSNQMLKATPKLKHNLNVT